MTGNNKVWRMPVACLASVAMLATVGVSAMTANAADENVTVTFKGTNGLMFKKAEVSGAEKESDTFTVEVKKGSTFEEAMNAAELARPDLKSGAYTGWYNTASYGVADSAVLSTEKVEADTTVYAHWTDENDGYYNVKFNGNSVVTGGQSSFSIDAADVIDPDQVPSTDAKVDGKVLAGWLNGDGEEFSDPTSINFYDAATAGTQNIDFTAQSEDAWTVTFHTENAIDTFPGYNLYIGDEKQSGSYAVDVDKDNNGYAGVIPTAKLSEDESKIASVWKTNHGKDASKLADFDESAKVESNLDLYPYRTVKYYTVTFDYGDARADVAVDVADGETVSAPSAVEYDYGTGNTFATNTSDQKLHKEFVSWQENGKDFDFATEITKNVTLTAKWETTEVGIDFDPNYGVAKAETVWFKDGDTFAAPAFEREGFTLNSWTPDGYSSWEGTTLILDGDQLKGYYGKDQKTLHTLTASLFKANWKADPTADLPGILANLESKVTVTKDGKYIKGSEQDAFTADSFDQYVKDYQAYLKSKGNPKTNEDYAKLIDKLEGLQGKLVQVADATLYRLYNPNDGDHYYTDNKDEAMFLSAVGWTQEKSEYKVVSACKANGFGTAVYSVYNPNTGEHLLTVDVDEAEYLESVGWNWDNDRAAKFYAPQNATKAVYRVYNPYTAGPAHHYADQEETTALVDLGWRWDNNGEPMFYFG